MEVDELHPNPPAACLYTRGIMAVNCDGQERPSTSVSEDEESFSGPVFRPPVYIQRYDQVMSLSRHLRPRKVIDMGCGECKLLRLLKFQDFIEELIGVDVDASILQSHRYRIQPLTADYLFRRPNPLCVQLMRGSISETDSRLQNPDLLSCIEVIEHLDASTLDAAPQSVFGFIRPLVAIFSTPNAEFNILFPRLTGFRHYDHKFEWTRKEFQNWCLQICSQYCYEVEFSGVGDPPLNMIDLGHCTQIAIFTRLPADQTEVTLSVENTYEMVYECNFPYQLELLSPEQKLSQEAEYFLHLLRRRREVEFEGEEAEETSNGEEEALRQREERDEIDEQERDTTINQALTNDSYRHTGQSSEYSNSLSRVSNGHVEHLNERTSVPEPVIINLEELLVFPQIQRLCSNVEDISRALRLHSNIQLRDDNHNYFAIIHEEEEEEFISEEDDDEEHNGEEERNGDITILEEYEEWD